MMSSNGCATLAAVAFMRPAASCLVAVSLPPHPHSSAGPSAPSHHTSPSAPSCFAAFPLHQPLSLGLDQPHHEWDGGAVPGLPGQGGFWGSCFSIHVCPGPMPGSEFCDQSQMGSLSSPLLWPRLELGGLTVPHLGAPPTASKWIPSPQSLLCFGIV